MGVRLSDGYKLAPTSPMLTSITIYNTLLAGHPARYSDHHTGIVETSIKSLDGLYSAECLVRWYTAATFSPNRVTTQQF